MTIFSIAFTLFLLMDPVGNIPIFLALLKKMDPRKQRRIILRELIIALLFIIAFFFIGDQLLSYLGVKQHSVMISGGIILFLISIKLIFPSKKDTDADYPREREPFIVPLAVPLVAGPAVLTAVMLYSRQEAGTAIVLSGIIIAWVVSTVILLASSWLKHVLGWRGITACERLMGLLLTLMAVEMFLEGLKQYLAS